MDGTIKIGMFGATEGTMHDIINLPQSIYLKSVTVRSINTIDRLTFTYEDVYENKFICGPWGGDLGNDHEFDLNSDEYVKEVSGTFGPFDPPTGHLACTVNSLNFVTSKNKTYAYGTPSGTAFKIPVESGKIVGFYALADKFVSAIGFYH